MNQSIQKGIKSHQSRNISIFLLKENQFDQSMSALFHIVKSRFYDIVGKQQIDIQRKMETLYIVNLEFSKS